MEHINKFLEEEIEEESKFETKIEEYLQSVFLNEEQKEIIRYILNKDNQNVFLTGFAGTGFVLFIIIKF